jgi:hypothetical protein
MDPMQDSINRVNQKYRELKRVKIILLDEVPKAAATATVARTTTVSSCKAVNLNGTPCKLKAKIGQYCMKHCP